MFDLLLFVFLEGFQATHNRRLLKEVYICGCLFLSWEKGANASVRRDQEGTGQVTREAAHILTQ